MNRRGFLKSLPALIATPFVLDKIQPTSLLIPSDRDEDGNCLWELHELKSSPCEIFNQVGQDIMTGMCNGLALTQCKEVIELKWGKSMLSVPGRKPVCVY